MGDLGSIADLARADSSLAHASLVCLESCAAYLIAVAHAIAAGDGPQAAYEAALRWARHACREDAVTSVLCAAASAPPPEYLTQQGCVLVALQNAFYQLLHVPSLEAGVVASVVARGDSDTNAPVAGALLGAIHGRETLPTRWRNLMLSCRPRAGRPGVRRPRPW